MQRDGLSHITEKPCLMYQTLLHKLLWYQKLHYIMLINSLSNPIHAISVQIYPASSRNTGVGITSSFGRIGSIVSPVVTVSLSENCRQKEAVFFMDLMLFLAAVACALIPLETKGRQIQWGSDAFFSLMYRITLHFGYPAHIYTCQNSLTFWIQQRCVHLSCAIAVLQQLKCTS